MIGSASRQRATSSGSVSAPAAARLWRSRIPRRGGPGTTQSPGPRSAARRQGTSAARRSASPSTVASTRQSGAGSGVAPIDARPPAPSVPVARSVVEPGVDDEVREVRRAGRVQVHGAGDAAVPPLVLVLDERGVRPLHDRQPQVVRAGPQERRHVELGREVRVLADPDVLAVELDEQHALGGAHVEHDTAPGPRRRDLERPLVDAGRVLVRRCRRAMGERHLDVRVDRVVPACPASSSSRAPRCRATPPPSTLSSGRWSSWKRHVPSSGTRSSCGTACIGSLPRDVSSGSAQGWGVIGRILRRKARGWIGAATGRVSPWSSRGSGRGRTAWTARGTRRASARPR